MIVVIPFAGGVPLAGYFGPVRGAEVGKRDIAIDLGVDLGQINPVGQTQTVFIQCRPADDHCFFGILRFRRVDRRGKGPKHINPGSCEMRISTDDEVGTSRQRPTDGLERLAPHDDRLAHRDVFEIAEIVGKSPGQPAIAADCAVCGDGDDQGNAQPLRPRRRPEYAGGSDTRRG